MADRFVHLHLHSEHSFLDGVPTFPQLIERIKEVNQDAVAVTDHGECSGHLRFQKAADKSDVKPIFGMEGYFCDQRTVKEGRKGELYDHITVLAKNEVGLHNLWALSSRAWIEGSWYGDPRFDWELLEEYHEGLIVTGGCLSGCVAKYLNPGNRRYEPDRAVERLSRFRETMGDDFYLELHTFDGDDQRVVNEALAELAGEYSVPVIGVSDSHYLRPEDWEDHELLTALSMGMTYDDPRRYQYGPNQLCVFAEGEVRERLSYLGQSLVGEAIDNTRLIADSCDAMIKRERSMPVFFDSADTDRIRMREMMEEGFKRKIEPHVPEEQWPVYRERLEYEWEIVDSKGFPGYFHTVRDLIKHVKDQRKLCTVRGSAAASLLCYLLNITEVDPIPPGLIFERFLDPGREMLPDIDMDFAHEDRPMVRAYAEEKYGQLNVATIGAFNVLKPRQLLKDLSRGLRVPPQDSQAIAKIIEKMPDLEVAHIETKWVDIYREFGPELDPWILKYPRLFSLMEKLGEHIRHSGIHSAGVVISRESLLGNLPLRFKSDDIRTAMDFHDVEDLGYVKYDVLGLRTLSTLQRCYELVMERHSGDGLAWYDDWHYEWEKYYEDRVVYEGLWGGKNIGIFQLESPGLRQLAKQFKPGNLEDLTAMVAIYRPGITRTVDHETGLNMLELYLQKRAGLRDPSYKHPLLEQILSVSHGSFVYQEQVMKTCSVMAGYDLSETDRVRRILGKKEVDKMTKERAIFVDGCYKTHEVQPVLAHLIFDDMEAFGKYGFNKAHSWETAMVAFWTAYMKHHYPREFMTALFQTNEDDSPLYARECQRLNIPLLGPDINESGTTFTLTPAGVIRYGLSKIKFLANASTYIVPLQPFANMEDFYARIPRTKVTKRAVFSAARVGALDSIADDAGLPDWWNQAQVALYEYLQLRGGKDARELDDECEQQYCQGHSKFEHQCNDMKVGDRAECERELLGSAVSVDPLKPYIQLIASEETFVSEADMFSGEVCRLGGIISRVNPLVTKRGANPGSRMCQFWVETPTGVQDEESGERDDSVQIVCWPSDFVKYETDIAPGVPVLCDVKRLENGGVCLVKLFRLDRL